MPLSELRGGIPLALYLGYSPLESYVLAVLGNIIPVPFILLLLDKIKNIKIKFISKIYLATTTRIEKQRSVIEKYGYVGLMLFVAVPLPITGAWTGSFLAFLLGLNKLKSFLAISVGVSLAGVIVTLTSIGVLQIINLF
ncbi:MAG TPA: ligand-binding protein SH3 [Archaeoglobus profundus]|nr:ligand-binding protein SH3 [Archaeoglobus profundus]HIP58144.1 ligand-binding protein SH3 [Archaeoglobus profundus]